MKIPRLWIWGLLVIGAIALVVYLMTSDAFGQPTARNTCTEPAPDRWLCIVRDAPGTVTFTFTPEERRRVSLKWREMEDGSYKLRVQGFSRFVLRKIELDEGPALRTDVYVPPLHDRWDGRCDSLPEAWQPGCDSSGIGVPTTSP
jgi:hypothetical protein